MDMGPTQPPIQWVPGALSLGVERSGCEADYLSPYSAEVRKCVELYLRSPITPSWRGVQSKHRDNFTFYLHHYACRSETRNGKYIPELNYLYY